MSYQTGTVVNLNDLLNEFATFLAAAGWTIDGNWREGMVMRTQEVFRAGGPVTEYVWRWGRRVHAHKGAKYISMQDFYQTKDIVYGTNAGISGGTSIINGPGISGSISTTITTPQPADPPVPAVPGTIGLSMFPGYTQPGAPGSVNGIIRTVTMPLPSIVAQPGGTWVAGEPVIETTPGLLAPFGIPGGAAIPCKYWFFADATGDNVIMCALRDRGEPSYMPLVSYMYFGDVRKGGAWTGGPYLGACHGNNFAWTNVATGGPYEGYNANRWGPPGSMMDGSSVHTLLRIDIDSFNGAGKYAGLQTDENVNIWTGRHFSSSTALVPKASDPSPGVFGIQQNGLHSNVARLRRSVLFEGAPLWPTYWVALRDAVNGIQLYSVLGVLPNIFQANTQGFAPGEEYAAKDGTVYVIFDGFAVKKVP